MTLSAIRRRLSSTANRCDRQARAAKYLERRAWLKGRAHGMRLAMRMVERAEVEKEMAGEAR